jgi:uncharacterized protein (TIGR03032 family)
MNKQGNKTKTSEPSFRLITDRNFPAWLASQEVSLAFTTYQTGKLFLIGLKPGGKLSIFSRNFNRAMGLWANAQQIYMATAFQLWRFENILPPGGLHGIYDRLYVPMGSHTTGDIDIHDIGLDGEDRLVFANTLFSCLATTSQADSFAPIWQPPFISALHPEDRCHLNGLAMKDGRMTHVTAVSDSDVSDGWRDFRDDGGILVDVEQNQIVLTGLSMPHSPRWHDATLYLLDSGNGSFGRVDLDQGVFEPIAFCPGYLRGLAFIRNYAVVGLSKPRDNQTFTGLALDRKLAEKKVKPRCGLLIIDLNTYSIVHWLNIEGKMGEMYDVAVLPGVKCPSALGFKTDEIQYTIKLGTRFWSGQRQ